MPEFKVGDKVRCLKHYSSPLALNMVYTVTEAKSSYGRQYLSFASPEGDWSATRFELVEDKLARRPKLSELGIGAVIQVSDDLFSLRKTQAGALLWERLNSTGTQVRFVDDFDVLYEGVKDA